MMKNCLKYITLLTLVSLCSFAAQAGGKFMPIKPIDHTMIHGKKFIGLGGGQDPIKVAKLKEDYFNLRTRPLRMPPKPFSAAKEKEETPETLVEDETAIEPIKDFSNAEEVLTKVAPAVKPQPESIISHVLPWNKSVTHQWPVDETVKSRISSPYGYRKHPITGKHSFHAGLDIAAPKGTKVIASSEGEITDLGRHKNLGKYVKVSHYDGTYSLYGHLSKITAKIGHEVTQGQKIGEIGSTGRSTGPHLDYSLRRNGEPMNPAKFLKRRNNQQVALAN